MDNLMRILMWEMTVPKSYGWYHWLWMGIIVCSTVLLCLFYRKCTDAQYRRLLLLIGLVNLVLEAYKQLTWASYNPDTGQWKYVWGEFPLVFCSTPMYVMTAAGLIRHKKIQAYLNAYLGTFSFLAGVMVLLVPSSVIFRQYIGINIQTMVCHGAMIVIGVFSIVTGRCAHTWKTILRALAVFAGFLVVADVMNIVWWYAGERSHVFNMMHASPYYKPYLPVYENIWAAAPYPVYLLLYTLGFLLGGLLLFYAVRGGMRLYTYVRQRRNRD